MMMNPMTGLWARTGLVWFLLTMTFGMYLGMTGQFGFSSPHAHLGLLGWLSSAAFAFLYAATGATPRGARLHWAAHNVGVATMATALFLTLKGVEGAGMVIPLGGTIVILATLWLTAMLWPRLR